MLQYRSPSAKLWLSFGCVSIEPHSGAQRVSCFRQVEPKVKAPGFPGAFVAKASIHVGHPRAGIVIVGEMFFLSKNVRTIAGQWYS